MYLIVGLGNPGSKYAGTRHNLGFQVVEALSRRLKSNKPVQKHWALCAAAEFKGRKVMLAQPLTYMNRSGRAVVELVRNYHIEPDRIMVIYDDLDLPPGVIRLRKKGGSAGHRGIQSIIESLGTAEFPRLRIGVGKPPEGMDAADYVLKPAGAIDAALIEEALAKAGEAVLVFISDGLEAAMNIYNQGLPSSD
jgi:peptidyl-tRNA hydrolase, PTH1 family